MGGVPAGQAASVFWLFSCAVMDRRSMNHFCAFLWLLWLFALIDFGGQDEIAFGEAVNLMRPDFHAHFAPR